MEGGIKALGGGLVEAFEEVPVCVEGGSDGRVSKTLLDHFRVLTLADQQGDVGVSQVMESAWFSDGGLPALRACGHPWDTNSLILFPVSSTMTPDSAPG